MKVLLNRTIFRTVCGDCGNIVDDRKTMRNIRACTACGSEHLFFELLNLNKNTVRRYVYLNRSGVDHSRPKSQLRLNRRKVREAPGTAILRIADFLYSPATVEKIFKQEIADWRIEYYEALKKNQTWKTRWICCRHYWAIAKAVSLDRIVTWFDRVLRRI